jgi:hypothetical protein
LTGSTSTFTVNGPFAALPLPPPGPRSGTSEALMTNWFIWPSKVKGSTTDAPGSTPSIRQVLALS